jgi:hypothetical protein
MVALLLACTVAYYAPYDHIIEADVEALRIESAAYLASVREAIPTYDPPTESVYEALENPPEPSSVLNPDFYLGAYEKIDALIIRAASVARNHETIKMLNLLKSSLQKIEYLEAEEMNVMQLDMVAMALDGQFEAILDLERHKKGGQHGGN